MIFFYEGCDMDDLRSNISHLSETTRKIYLKCYEKLDEAGVDPLVPEEVREYGNKLSVSQRKTLYKTVKYIDRDNSSLYTDLLNQFTEEEREIKRGSRTYSKNEVELLKYFDLVMKEGTDIERYMYIWSKLSNTSVEKSLIMLHLFHPLRSDYYTVKIRNYDINKDNYYSNGKIYFNTLVKVNRRLTITLSVENKLVLDNYISVLPECDNLFQWTNSNSYTQALRRISSMVFNESFSINKFRHLRDFPDGIKEIIDRLNSIATGMNHTLLTHADKY